MTVVSSFFKDPLNSDRNPSSEFELPLGSLSSEGKLTLLLHLKCTNFSECKAVIPEALSLVELMD